ncbi:MAG: hypothetical protein Roseis2KO_39950 [Roseivirga sp.]
MKHLLTLILLLSSLFVFSQSLDEGIRLYKIQQLDQAGKALKTIKSSDPAYAEAQFYLGRVAFDKEEYDDARDYFEEATEANNTNADYYTWLGNAIGTVAQDAGKLRQASLAPKIKNAYLKAVELEPKSLDAQWGLLQFYTQAPGFMGGSWEKAEQAARAIALIDPLEGHDALATVYLRKEEPELAEKEYLAAAELAPNRLGNLGVFYQNQQWYDKAFATFQKAFSQFPENMSLLYQVGRTSALSGTRPELGIKSLEQYMAKTEVEKASPSHAAAKMRLAMIYEKQGDTAKAKTLYQASLADDPEMDLAKKGLKRVR